MGEGLGLTGHGTQCAGQGECLFSTRRVVRMVLGLGQTPGPCAGPGMPATPRAGGQVRQVTCAQPWCPALRPGVEQQGLLQFQAQLPGDGGGIPAAEGSS